MLQLIYLTYSLTDNSPWKLKFFVFVIFIFSTLHHFSEKIYEKTYCFYNMFSKFSSICARLPSFTIWIFFSKKWWLFQLNIHISMFEQLLQENLWKDIPFSHIYTNSLSRSTLSQSFTIWKFLLKKCQLFQNVNKFLLIWATLSNFCTKT